MQLEVINQHPFTVALTKETFLRDPAASHRLRYHINQSHNHSKVKCPSFSHPHVESAAINVLACALHLISSALRSRLVPDQRDVRADVSELADLVSPRLVCVLSLYTDHQSR